jgi:hypothetical protein
MSLFCDKNKSFFDFEKKIVLNFVLFFESFVVWFKSLFEVIFGGNARQLSRNCFKRK